MSVLPGNAQHQGQRNDQQDEFWFSDIEDHQFIAHGGVLAVVADGMGGLEKGGEASCLAARVFGAAYLDKKSSQTIPNGLKNALDEANEAVCALSHSINEYGNVGTTLVAAVIAGPSLYWLSVGDSRLYLFRQGELTQLTHDHSYGEKLKAHVAAGLLSAEEADNSPDRHALTSYVGLPVIVEIDSNLKPFCLEPDDWLLLCSDGLHGALTGAEIVETLVGTPQEAADKLIQQVIGKALPHQDNVTVAIMAYQADTPKAMPKNHNKRPDNRHRSWFLGGLAGVGVLAVAIGGLVWNQVKPLSWPIAQEMPIAALAKPPDATTNGDITHLMALAQEYVQKGDFVAPPGHNALEEYQHILMLAADYAPAKEALGQMRDLLIRQALAAIKAGKAEAARQAMDAGRKVQAVLDPNDKLNELQRQLDGLQPKNGAVRLKPNAGGKVKTHARAAPESGKPATGKP